MSARALRRVALAGLAVAVAIAIGLLATSGDHGYRLRVQMDDAAGLRKDFVVKIAGAPVGKVVDVQLDRDDRGVALLELDAAAAPVGRDARAAIRSSNLLGEKYVDLTPGDATRPAPSGFEIVRARTATPSDLDDLLSVLDPDTRVALSAFLVNQGDALVGRGADLAAALQRMPRTLDAAHELVAGLGHDNRALGSLVRRSDRILASAVPRRQELGRLVATAGDALATLDGRRERLGATVRRAPAAIRQLRASLTELERAAQPLRPAARGLQATAPPLTETLRALPSFGAAARPTLRTARSVAPSLERLGAEATPVVQRLTPVGADLRTFSTALRPVTKLLDLGIADTLGVMQGWARAIQNRDPAGHVFRVNVELGGDLLDLLNRYVQGPTTAGRARATRPPATGSRSAAAAPRPSDRRPDAAPTPTTPPAPRKPPAGSAATPPGTEDRPAGNPITSLLDLLLHP